MKRYILLQVSILFISRSKSGGMI